MALSIGSVLQYLFYIVVGYVLVGSPILRMFFNDRAAITDLNETFINTDRLVIPDENLVCPEHGYNVHILSRDPLVIVIPDFLSGEEAKHMVAIR